MVLDEKGKPLSSAAFASKLGTWIEQSGHVSFLIGGPDGLAPDLQSRADEQNVRLAASISLSALTFPHPLVRVILAEQLYRAWSINHGHPYHRE